MTATKYVHIGKINFINGLVYFWDNVAHSLFIGLIFYVFTQLWTVVYGDKILISGFTIAMMLWYFVMAESIVTSYGRLIEEIGTEVKTGEVANALNKPYHYIIYKYASSLGAACLRFFITFAVGVIVLSIFIREIGFQWVGVPFVLITVFLAITLNFIMMAFLGIFAFWFEEAEALYFVYQKFVFTIGGMIFPLDIFPVWLAKIAAVLPFSYVAYHPAKLFVAFTFSGFLKVVAFQLVWIVIFSGAAFLLYSMCVKRLSANGG
ncbi:ABC transporter permease [Nanoarchaeota archaeon]